MTISERIFERLRQLSMTQKEFAESSGIQQSTISEWSNRGPDPTKFNKDLDKINGWMCLNV